MRDIIAKLPPETYPILADYFGRIAADLRHMTERRCMAQVCMDKFEERSDRMKNAASRAAHLPDDEAIRQMQADGAAGPLAAHYLSQARKQHTAAARAERDLEIAAMLKDEISKVEISRRLRVHVSTVFRIAAKLGEK